MTRVNGVDLGGTWLRVGTVDASKISVGGSLEVHRYPSPTDWDALVGILKRRCR